VTYQLEPRLFEAPSTAGNIRVGQVIECVSSSAEPGPGFLMAIDGPSAGKKAATAIEYFGVALK
jgi:hypothetical protein